MVTIVPDAFLALCPSRTIAGRVGEKWALLLIVALADGPRRFGELRRKLEGISQKMLTQTARALERDGLVSRHVFDEMPLRVEYRLTPLGEELLPVARAVKDWAEAKVDVIEAHRLRYDARHAAGDTELKQAVDRSESGAGQVRRGG